MIDLQEGVDAADKAVDSFEKKPYPTFLVIILIIMAFLVYFLWTSNQDKDEKYDKLVNNLLEKNNIISSLRQDSIKTSAAIMKIDTAVDRSVPIAQQIIKKNSK